MVKDIICIVLLLFCTVTALKDVARINSRRAQQQRIRTIRKPNNREMRL